MKYIEVDMQGVEQMEYETNGDVIVAVRSLVDGIEAPSPKAMNTMLDMYMRSPNSTIVRALGSFISSYSTLREVVEQENE